MSDDGLPEDLLHVRHRLPDMEDDDEEENHPPGDPSMLEKLGLLRDVDGDGLDIIDKDMLGFPQKFLRPLMSNAVSPCAQVLPESRLEPSGQEMVFMGKGLTVPENINMVVWIFTQINNFGKYTGSVVPTKTTKLMTDPLAPKKSRPVTGILMEVTPVVIESLEHDCPAEERVPSFMQRSMQTASAGMINGERVYYNAPMVKMEWGLIPVQYQTLRGKKVRDLIHTLRVVPAPGFDLLNFLETRIFSQVHQKGNKEQMEIVLQIAAMLKRVMNVEMAQLDRYEVWNALPHPCESMSVMSAVSPINILSPFAAMFKIRRIVGPYEPGTLVVDKFPDISSTEKIVEASNHMYNLSDAYRVVVKAWQEDFSRAQAKEDDSNPTILTPVLWHNNRCLDRLNCSINMRVKMHVTPKYSETMKMKLPALALASMTHFLIMDENATISDMSRDDFITASVQYQMEEVTTTSVDDNASSLAGIMSGFPRAGMFSHTWNAHRNSIYNMAAESQSSVARVAGAMSRYLTIQSTILNKGTLMDLFVSDRILETARLLVKVSETDICGDVGRARDWAQECMRQPMTKIESLLLWDEMQMAEYAVAAAWCEFNEHAIMNAMNLNACRAVVISDILTFLGSHQSTFTWYGFINVFCGGAGHFLAKPVEGKTDYVGPSVTKANTTGHSAVAMESFNNIQRLARFKDMGLQNDVLELFCLAKLDRITRPGLESLCSVEIVNGVVTQGPSRSMFGRCATFDEYFRNVNTADGRTGFVALMPRDANSTGTTEKHCNDPRKDGGMTAGKVQQIGGFCPFVLALASNYQSPDKQSDESMKSTLAISNPCTPGAHKANGNVLQSNLAKRCRNELDEDTYGEKPSIPTNQEHCEHLASILTVVPMLCKQVLGLMNKTGLVDYEICSFHVTLFSWFKLHYKHLMGNAMGSLFLMSFDRVCGVQISRAVASTLNTTLTMHMLRSTDENPISMDEACIHAMSDTMSSALTLARCCGVMRDVICKTVDTNFLMINGTARAILKTPVLDLEFLRSCMNPAIPIDNTCAEFIVLRDYLADLIERRTPRAGPQRPDVVEMLGDYVVAPDLDTPEQYSQIAQYLEQHLSLIKNSYPIYSMAVIECTNRTLNLSNLLDIKTDVKLSQMCARMGLNYPREWDTRPSDGKSFATKFAYRVTSWDPEKKTNVAKVFINIPMHLFATALVGKNQLHSDNRETWACTTLGFMMRNMPVQICPSRMVIFDSFIDRDEGIIPQTLKREGWPSGASDYLARSKLEKKAWDLEESRSIKVNAWNYVLEDVIHMAAYIQMRTILKGGVALGWDDEFSFIPRVSIRAPELVPGRVYPLYVTDEPTGQLIYGTICVAPRGMACVVIKTPGNRIACSLSAWQQQVQASLGVVGPLVHRRNAVVNLGEMGLGVIVPRGGHPFLEEDHAEYVGMIENDNYSVVIMEEDDRYFMDCYGNYLIQPAFGDSASQEPALCSLHYRDVHTRLLKLGTRIAIEAGPLRELLGAARIPVGAEYVAGKLRYPDEILRDSESTHVYVCLKCVSRDVDPKGVIVGVHPRHCRLAADVSDYAGVIYE